MFVQEQDKYEFLNDVNVDDINKMDVNVDSLDRTDLYPASSDFVGEWESDFNTYCLSYLISHISCLHHPRYPVHAELQLTGRDSPVPLQWAGPPG